MMKFRTDWVVLFAVVVLVGTLYMRYETSLDENSVDRYDEYKEYVVDVDEHNYDVHWHALLLIDIDGELVTVPSEVGIDVGVANHDEDHLAQEVHTHKDDDVIHIEYDKPLEGEAAVYTLRDVFEAWGQDFSSTSILGYSSDGGTIYFKVNGMVSDEYEYYVIQDGDVIEISYVSAVN